MRIIGGNLGGLFLNVPKKMPHTRPTTQLAKEALFNVLANNIDFETLRCLDLFGGTGAISYELASRGAKEIFIVEKDNQMHDFIKQNIEKLKLQNTKVFSIDVFKFIEKCSQVFDFIFAGPPYSLENIEDLPQIIFEKKLLAINGIFVLEHTPKNNFEQTEHFKLQKNYGTTVFSFFVFK